MAVNIQSFVLLAPLLLLISITANEHKDCMAPVTDPTSLFGQSDVATPPLMEEAVDEYSDCNNLCCQTENCNVVVFLKSVGKDENNCVLYACHPTDTCNIHAQDGRLIFVSQSASNSEEFTSPTNVTTITTTTTKGVVDETDVAVDVTTESPLPEINQTELINTTSIANTTSTPVMHTGTITTSTFGLNNTSQTMPPSATTNTTTAPTPSALLSSQFLNTTTTTTMTPTVPPPPTTISPSNESTADSNSTITEGNNTNNEDIGSTTAVSIEPSRSLDMEAAEVQSPVLSPTSVTPFSDNTDNMTSSTTAGVNPSSTLSPDLSFQNLTSSDLQSSTQTTFESDATLMTLTPSMTLKPTLETLTSNTSLASSAQEITIVSSTVTFDKIPQSSGKDSSMMSTLQPESAETKTDLVATPSIIEASGSFNDTQNATLSHDASDTTESSEAMTAILICALTFGCVFMLAVVGVLGKRIYDGYKKRHYSRLDYLINGMYN